MTSYEMEEMEAEAGARLGDPRRCPKHPNVRTSSNDGMFDGLCGQCEAETEDYDAAKNARTFTLDQFTARKDDGGGWMLFTEASSLGMTRTGDSLTIVGKNETITVRLYESVTNPMDPMEFYGAIYMGRTAAGKRILVTIFND